MGKNTVFNFFRILGHPIPGYLQYTCPGWVGGVGGVGGFTVIIMQVSVQIGLNWNWPTGTELGNNDVNILLSYFYPQYSIIGTILVGWNRNVFKEK